MKRLIYVMSVVVAFALSLAACTTGPEEQQPTQSFLSLERDTLWVAATGVEEPELVAVNASSDKWIFSSDEAWLTVDQSFDLTTGYLNISVEENTAETSREAIVYLYFQDLTAQLVVVQLADTHVEAAHIIPADTLFQVPADGGVLPISVIADGEYTVTTDADWLGYDGQQTTDAGVVENFYIAKSFDKLPRYGVVTFASEQITTSVRVMQWGSQALFVDAGELSFVFMKCTPQTLTLTANGEWTPSCDAEWVSWEIKKGVVVDTLIVSVEDNASEARNATLTIACGSESASVNIAQEATREFSDVTAMASPADIQIKIAGAASSSDYTSYYSAIKAVDGKDDTYWYNEYSKDSDPWLTVKLNPKGYEQIDYMIYTPYYSSSSTSGQWGEVEIYVVDADGNETKYSTHDFQMNRQHSIYNFETPITGAKEIRFRILTSYNYYADKYPERKYATAQEIKLYTRNKTADPLTLFTDWSLSELRADVTLKQIEAMPVESYRAIAEQLYYGVYDGEFRICKFKAFPHPDRDAAIFRTNTYTLLDNVTGMYVAEVGDTVRVFVGDTYGTSVSLRIIDWVNCEGASAATSSRTYVSAQSKYVVHTYPLKEGYNEIVAAETRGLMYILCHSDNYENIPEMTAHFVNSEVNGYIELGKTDISRSYELLRKGGNTEPHFDMLSHRALLNFPKTLYYSGTFKKNSANTSRVEDLLHIFDTVMYIQEDIQGHYKYKALGKQRVHRNRALFHGTYTSYYGASSSYRTYYNISSMATGIVDPTDQWKKNVTHYSNDVVGSIWGLAHEMGHTNQTDLFKWQGLTEVTNNLMCAITQMIFYGEGNTTMRFNDHFNRGMDDLVTRTIWDFDEGGQWAERPITFCETTNTPRSGTKGGEDPTTQLMPFWQLYLYYHVVLGKTDFYPDFYELCRTKNIRVENYNSDYDLYHSAMMLEYMVTASEAAGEDLSEFSQMWGIPGINAAKGVNKGMKLYHYGQRYFITSAEQIAAKEQECQKFSKPKMNPLYIHDLNLDLYRNPQPVTAGTHSVDDNGNFTVSGWQNVVAWVLVDPTKTDLRTGEQGRVVAIKKWDDTKNGGFQYGLEVSRYKANEAFTDYIYTDDSKNNRALESIAIDYEYAKGLQLYAVDAYGTRYASQSNAQ